MRHYITALHWLTTGFTLLEVLAFGTKYDNAEVKMRKNAFIYTADMIVLTIVIWECKSSVLLTQKARVTVPLT